MPVGIEERYSHTEGATGRVVRRRGAPHRLTGVALALRLLLGGGACCVTGLFGCGRAAGAAGRANLPVLDHHVLLVWT